jgi:hypothetical protein
LEKRFLVTISSEHSVGSPFYQSVAIQGISAPVFTSIITEVMASVTVEAFCRGNVDGSDAIAAQMPYWNVFRNLEVGVCQKRNTLLSW